MTFSGPTLKHFLLRQQVIHLYRHAIRASKVISHPVTRGETISWIRHEIDRNKHLNDVAVIEDRIKIIRREIKSILPTYSKTK